MPRRDFDKLHEEIEELFSDLWQVPRFLGQRGGFRPNVDSYRIVDPHELVVLVELPGADPASIRVVVGGRTLVVSGDRTRPRVDGRVFQMEIEYGPFQRQVRLPEDVDPARSTAAYEHGILRITLPVLEAETASGTVTIAVNEP
jgi:HSP20 family protein